MRPAPAGLRTAALLAAAALALAGCVERKMFVRSDPPGAAVHLNHSPAPVGVTPLEVDFDYYGVYAVRLVKDGYEDLEVAAPVPAPWYAWPGLDFLTELVLPLTIRDHHQFDYALRPVASAPPIESPEALEQAAREAAERDRALRERAEELRRRASEPPPEETE